ncbi:unnamed protein product [Paramecium primaurelia]|uniref:Transmembrane protein n=1 Tax=Paramecium primaurelia TaxID=5886 RepID=A0A8S1LKU7_PARPR|nr:unnamed protein product [Paramecium primaurelia]
MNQATPKSSGINYASNFFQYQELRKQNRRNLLFPKHLIRICSLIINKIINIDLKNISAFHRIILRKTINPNRKFHFSNNISINPNIYCHIQNLQLNKYNIILNLFKYSFFYFFIILIFLSIAKEDGKRTDKQY